jgi:hypothetical protein
MGLFSKVTDTLGITDTGAAEKLAKKGMNLSKEQLKRMRAIKDPDLKEIIYQNPELVGLLEAEQLDPSAMEEIKLDAALKSRQMEALEGMRERSEQGITEMDKLQMEQMLGQAGAQEKAAREGIEAEMQRRGTADSGTSLIQKLQGAQGSGNQARQKAMQMAAQAQQAKMQALQGMGQMAGQMGQQDWQRQSQVASARDAIAKANAMNRQNVSAQNLAARQRHEDQRAATANKQAAEANRIAQQKFQNQMQKETGQMQAANQVASQYGQQSQAMAAADAATMNTLGNLAGIGLEGYMAKEDGGLAYEDGGVHNGTRYAENGEIMFDSEGEGAIVGGDSFERDRVDARLNSGEAVLNVAQQQRLMDLLRGEANVNDLGDEDIVEGVPREFQEELTEEIDNGKDNKIEGLKKLLQALGE